MDRLKFKEDSQKLSAGVLLILDLIDESLAFKIILLKIFTVIKESLFKLVF